VSFSAGSGYIELTVAVGSDAEPGVTVLTAEALTVRTTQDTLETDRGRAVEVACRIVG
jgi:hypothetical protein